MPEGTQVKKGDVVCKLDSASLEDSLVSLVDDVRTSKTSYETARLAHEAARSALNEYTEETFALDLKAVSDEIELARSDVERAEERVKRTQIARRQIHQVLAGQERAKTPSEVFAWLDIDDRLASAEHDRDAAGKALEAARLKKETLTKYTKDRQTKKLQMAVETARSIEQAARVSWDLRQAKGDKLRGQIEACHLYAPADGVLVYANDPSRPASATIREGSMVLHRQKIFSVVDFHGPMRLIAKVGEPVIDRVERGQTAQLKVRAFPDQTFSGVVRTVAPLPDPQAFFQDKPSLYTVRIEITDGDSKLRPGMGSSAEILTASLDDVLTVPVQSIVPFEDTSREDTFQVAVKTPDGGIDWRDVTLGKTDGTMIEIKEGLKSGETVIVNPIPLLSEDQKRQMQRFRSSHRPARPKAKGNPPQHRDEN